MSREVCGICWCPYDEDTGKCACKPRHVSYVCPQCHWSLDVKPTHPERRLTDEVIAELWYKNGTHHHHFARAIERWLKEEK